MHSSDPQKVHPISELNDYGTPASSTTTAGRLAGIVRQSKFQVGQLKNQYPVT